MKTSSSFLVLIVIILFSTGCRIGGFKIGPADKNIKVISLPDPKTPSQVLGIGEAMSAGKDILIYRMGWKPQALPDDERNLFFISKLMNSYSKDAKVIELPNFISYSRDDYYYDLGEHIPSSGFAVIKKEDSGFKLHRFETDYSEKYEALVEPIKLKLEEVLGPSDYSKSALIAQKSGYPKYNKAIQDGKSMIICNFAGACGSFKASEKKEINEVILPAFSDEAEIFEISHKTFTDPANELYSTHNNMISVYNHYTKKVYPALFSRSDLKSNIRKFLDER